MYFVLKSNLIKHKNLIKRERDASLQDLTTSKTEEVPWLGRIAISLSWKSQESKKHVILHCEAKAFSLWVMHKYLEMFQVTLMKVFMKVESIVVYHRHTAIQAVWPAPRYFSTTPNIYVVKSAITLQHSVMADSLFVIHTAPKSIKTTASFWTFNITHWTHLYSSGHWKFSLLIKRSQKQAL